MFPKPDELFAATDSWKLQIRHDKATLSAVSRHRGMTAGTAHIIDTSVIFGVECRPESVALSCGFFAISAISRSKYRPVSDNVPPFK